LVPELERSATKELTSTIDNVREIEIVVAEVVESNE
jgi:hypothetical protein